jgi:tetratricopeptide (TPR) repeat protein
VPDYTKTCFVIMPFGSKPVGKHRVDFDKIYDEIFVPAVSKVVLPEGRNLVPARTDRDFYSGDIGQEMFQYLQWSRFALADITGLNANVLYELGVRHSVRESGTVILRQTNAPIPFDISHIKAFPYDYRPEANAREARKLIQRILTESLVQNRLDSPVQLSLRAQRETPDLEPVLKEAENAIRRLDRPAAISILREALRVSVGNALIHQRVGLLLKDQGEHRDAWKEFRAAVTRSPLYAEGWREKGITESLLARKPGWDGENGEAALRRAIELNPNDFDALASLGGVLRRQKRLDEAQAMYERSVEVSSGHPYPLLMAIKLRARATGTLDVDYTLRAQLLRAERMRNGQAELQPPFDVPWCQFDSAEIRLYLGDAAGFSTWLERGLRGCEHRWQTETFESALRLLVDGGLKLEGLEAGIARIQARAAELA